MSAVSHRGAVIGRGLAQAAGLGGARWVAILAMLVAWEGFARSGAVTPFMLPPFSVVVQRIWTDALSGELPVFLGLTLYRALTGFVLAAVPGIVLGILVSRVAALRWFLDPVISVGFPMPKIAFLPVVMLWFGVFDTSKIFMIVFDAVFPVLTATIAATQRVEHQLLWSARSLGADERELLWEVILPASVPQILTGLQVALPISLIIAIIAEMIMGGEGLGGAMITASRFADSPGVFAGLVEIAIAGICLIRGLAYVRRRLLHWHQETREPTSV